MKRTRAGITVLLACAVIAMTLQPVSALAATCEKWAGKVVSAQGVVEAKPAGETRWQAVKLNETYCPGDTIRTDRKSRADIALSNHPLLRLDQNSTVTLGGMKDEKTSLVDMVSGAALFFSRVTRNLEVRTATVNAGVEGTEFFIRVEEGKTDLTVFEGKVLASNAAGGLPVTTGQSAVAEAGKAPVYRVVVRPRDAVHWALYYPPVLDPRPSDLKEESNDPRFYTTRASQLLAVGRVDEATADIDKAQKLDPKNSDAFALLSMIAVTQNEKGKALELAQQAVTADPKSATAMIALSYAQQAHFDLKGALGSLEEAVKLAPGNALAWARLAELQQSFGYLDKSLDSAKKAVALNPDLSRTQTVLGFSHLTRIETKEAQGAFEKAIKLDDADPLPRLGLGLAKIRDGNLEEGRREIEIAMSLDPNNSLIRSYLGKAYYEEKRDKLATGQFDMAKSLDPSDPTPYFYDAIEKQTTNRPVEALQDMEKAIALNDNRAVYRSRMLLDDDLAARSASIGRIYSDLGFQQRALTEGWKSLNYDPSNYSAHRFQADLYAALPRNEIARVSELLQSQLLQPINITPVQPRLAESNLLAISAGGPGNLSFNEFNPLFERNRAALQANGIVGENSTWGEEIVVSGLYNKFSASAGQYHYQADGFRANNDLKDDIYDVFVQWSPSHNTSLQAEYRGRRTDQGDLSLRFFPDAFDEGFRQKQEYDLFRFGFHHKFSIGSDLILNFMYKDQELPSSSTIPDVFTFENIQKQKSLGGELQYLHKLTHLNIIGGLGYVDTSGDITNNFIDAFDPTFNFSSTTNIDSQHANGYVYAYLNYLKNVTFTLGLSYDSIRGGTDLPEIFDQSQWNPKIGVTWNPVPDTTIRAAAFRVLKRDLINSATLEPTQVAGFTQFYDDAASTDTWNYGIGVDQKFLPNLFGGLALSYRDMSVPARFVGPNGSDIRVDWEETLGRAYMYWAPHKWFGLNAEYQYEKINRDEEFTLTVKELTTQRIPLGASFFHPSGLSAKATATYYDQSGQFQAGVDPITGTAIFVDDSDQFWVFDASISYRLPERYGMIIIGAKNLFNQTFKYYDTNPLNPAIQPDRMFFAKINLSF
jgi:Tfp pilus assembly protein PilF